MAIHEQRHGKEGGKEHCGRESMELGACEPCLHLERARAEAQEGWWFQGVNLAVLAVP